MEQKEPTFAATTWVMLLVNSVEQRAPNMCAILQTSVVSGLVSSGITLEKSICTPSNTSDRNRGMIRYTNVRNHINNNESCIPLHQGPFCALNCWQDAGRKQKRIVNELLVAARRAMNPSQNYMKMTRTLPIRISSWSSFFNNAFLGSFCGDVDGSSTGAAAEDDADADGSFCLCSSISCTCISSCFFAKGRSSS